MTSLAAAQLLEAVPRLRLHEVDELGVDREVLVVVVVVVVVVAVVVVMIVSGLNAAKACPFTGLRSRVTACAVVVVVVVVVAVVVVVVGGQRSKAIVNPGHRRVDCCRALGALLHNAEEATWVEQALEQRFWLLFSWPSLWGNRRQLKRRLKEVHPPVCLPLLRVPGAPLLLARPWVGAIPPLPSGPPFASSLACLASVFALALAFASFWQSGWASSGDTSLPLRAVPGQVSWLITLITDLVCHGDVGSGSRRWRCSGAST